MASIATACGRRYDPMWP